METYDLIKANKIQIPQLSNYMGKMNELNQVIEEIEEIIKKEENKGKNVCICGYKLKSRDRFCPNYSELVPRDTKKCACKIL